MLILNSVLMFNSVSILSSDFIIACHASDLSEESLRIQSADNTMRKHSHDVLIEKGDKSASLHQEERE